MDFVTCVARCPIPSTFTTRSIFYVARVVFTVGWAWFVTVDTKYTRPITSLVKTQGTFKMSKHFFLKFKMEVLYH